MTDSWCAQISLEFGLEGIRKIQTTKKRKGIVIKLDVQGWSSIKISRVSQSVIEIHHFQRANDTSCPASNCRAE
jgi:hypothetical protein